MMDRELNRSLKRGHKRIARLHIESHIRWWVVMNPRITGFLLLSWKYLAGSFAGPYLVGDFAHPIHREWCSARRRYTGTIAFSHLGIAVWFLR